MLPCCTLCLGIKKEKLLKYFQENPRLSWKQLLGRGQRLGGNKQKLYAGQEGTEKLLRSEGSMLEEKNLISHLLFPFASPHRSGYYVLICF